MRFVLFTYPRSGSTLLITALGEHPGVRQGMEIFNPVLEGEAPWVDWRRNRMAELYGERDSYLDSSGYLDGGRFDLVLLARDFFEEYNGVKILYDQLDRNSGVWGYLDSLPELKFIFLRRNIVEAAVSFRIAMETNVWHVAPGEGDAPSPAMIYDPAFFGWYYDHFCSDESHYMARFENRSCLHLEYDDLVCRWSETTEACLRHLGLKPMELPVPYVKRTQGTAGRLISNFNEIRRSYENHPVLSLEFEAAALAAGVGSNLLPAD